LLCYNNDNERYGYGNVYGQCNARKIMDKLLEIIKGCKKCTTIIGHRKFPLNSHGNLISKAILVSKAPGKDSLVSGQYWVGTGGKLLRGCLPQSCELEDLFYLTDIVKCWPNDSNENRTPFENEILNCSTFLVSEIETLKPKLVIPFGEKSSSFLLKRKISITKEHGNLYSKNNVDILVLLHPSGIDRFMKREIYLAQLKALFLKIKDKDYDNLKAIFELKTNPVKKQDKSIGLKPKQLTNSTNVTFSIPSSGNSITDLDVEKYQIRITSDFKDYFPSQNEQINIEYNNIKYPVSFTFKGSRSHIIKLGKILANKIKLKSGMTIKMSKTGIREYKIE
jgi:uracil-DNA glycosylase